ncbi:MAG: LicD family protein [Lachnospiraceae bacterium]|nr:LicD family protein [Lachnospiraceae bacterium]
MSVHFELSEDFFRDEIRDGFEVKALMKRCWGAQLRVLEQFDKVCEAHSLKWFAYVGTLLGAVRHKGFVPWDDDVDIAMMREDYENFLRFAPLELPEGYLLLNYDDGDHEYDCMTRLNNFRTVMFDESRTKEYCSFPFPAGLDIYPLDYVVEDPGERKAHSDLHYRIFQATELCRKILSGSGPLSDKDGNHLEPAELLAEISMMTGFEFDLDKDIIRQLNVLLDLTDSMNSEEESAYIANMGHLAFEGERMMFPKDCFEHIYRVPFETGYVYIPEGYDRILSGNYGKKYIVPRNKSPHDYPYYGQHQTVVREFMEKNPGVISEEWASKYL